ncbi:carboxypeptidase-like regulatory domain-containing protein, partial [Xanthovirga aplysinae]|uniref:carboxypeptidase-like regulatory domain-containing protein n=1 Tax=Xanthovirga aplysinae TaxID=2529853 RepID=UPI0016569E2A
TDGQGNYSVRLEEGWSGTISPQKEGYSFSPSSMDINNIQQNLTGQDFTAAQITTEPVTYTLSGQVVDTEGSPLEQVTLTGLLGNISTDAQGNYSVRLAENWSGTISPQKEGYSFSPNSIDVNKLQQDLSGQNFTATLTTTEPVTFTLSGQVVNTEGYPLGQVALSGLPENTFTDGYGNYSVSLPENWSGTINPQKEGYSFSPGSIAISSLQQDLSEQIFTATIPD